MKKVILLTSTIVMTSVANAQTTYYTSVKMGIGDTAIYIDNAEFGDFLVKSAERNTGYTGFKYDSSGLLLELSPAMGIDWTLNNSGWFHIRLEGELGYNRYRENGKLKYNSMVTDKTEVEFNDFFFLVNGYTDFRIHRIIPYIGFGLGHGWGKNKIMLSNAYGEFGDSIHDDGLLVALHFGVAYKYSNITTFDLGFRNVYAPTEDDGSYNFTTLRLGARFRI